MTEATSAASRLDRIQGPALVVGLLGLVASGAGWLVTTPRQFFLSYLFAFVFWAGLALGSVAILMIQHLTGGAWGLVIRRPLESGARMIPWMAVFFVPIAFGLEDLYEWTGGETSAGVAASDLQGVYLTKVFFLGRTAFYFLVWIALALALGRMSRAEDTEGPERLDRRYRVLSAAGLVIYGLTATFAAVDWVMSLTPHWHSTIFGVIFMAGGGLGSLALMIALLVLLSRHEPFSGILRADHFRDLGNLLLAFTMFWAYVAFSQYLIIWSADISHEVPYYMYRQAEGWKWLALTLIVLHFFVPFFILLGRWSKENTRVLGAVAALILLMRPVDLFWMIAPASAQAETVLPLPGFHIHWLDFAIPLGIGGVWIALFVRHLKLDPLIPPRDPRLRGMEAHD